MLSKEEFGSLQVKYRRVCQVTANGIDLVIRAPSRAEYRAFRSAMHNPASVADAQEDLVRDLVVWCNGAGDGEARAAFDALLDEYPALCENKAVSGEVQRFTGLEFASMGKASAAPAKLSEPAQNSLAKG